MGQQRPLEINKSLNQVRRQLNRSPDPSKENHYFVLAAPVEKVAKLSSDKRKAVEGKVFQTTNFAGEHSQVFRRLGLDLVNVSEDGSAVVHMKPEVMDQLASRTQALQNLGAKEQSRWATIERFDLIPAQLRIDAEWLDSLTAKKSTDAVIEFQPLLVRAEIDSLIRTIISTLHSSTGEAISGTGTDFSGRQWLRGAITPESLSRLSRDFFAVQSLHSPLNSKAASHPPIKVRGSAKLASEIDVASLPTIGVVDMGVPLNHAVLAKFRRGSYSGPTSSNAPADDHGCFVSSRVVFGDVDCSTGTPNPAPMGSARYFDINVGGISRGDIDDKSVVNPAMQAIVSTSPDVRVFNLSFDTQLPLDEISLVKRSEFLNLVQDLDNFIFQNDVLVVVAAGNSAPGQIPSTAYPHHQKDPGWGLGAWARSFNSLTCGSYVGHINPGGLVGQLYWPSPFCRVGPGLCNSPKPDFSANGGNGASNYNRSPGLGVGGLAANGLWEDRSGASFAAPLLAREAVFTLQRLQQVCERGAQPFGVTAKAFLALTALPPVKDSAVRELVERTLGRGTATAKRLESPAPDSGVMIWQGVLEDDKDIARVQVPIPLDWVKETDQPRLRIIVAWDPPVNAAVKQLWATRHVSAKLRTHPETPALRASTTRSHESYPIFERTYDLRKLPNGIKAEGDMWLVEIAYEQIAAYHPAMTFPPQQRVAFAAELFDAGEHRHSPQQSLQALSAAKSMNRLTVPPAAARLPVVLRNPL